MTKEMKEILDKYFEHGDLAIHAGLGMARGLFMGVNLKTGKVSYWAQHKSDIRLSDCIY